MTHPVIARYLLELTAHLDAPPGERLRIVQEVEAHLVETATELGQAGLAQDDAAASAVKRFGRSDVVAAGFHRDPGRPASLLLRSFHAVDRWWAAHLMVAPCAATAIGSVLLGALLSPALGSPARGVVLRPFGAMVVALLVSRLAQSFLVRRRVEPSMVLRLGLLRAERPVLARSLSVAPLVAAVLSSTEIRLGASLALGLIAGPLVVWAARRAQTTLRTIGAAAFLLTVEAVGMVVFSGAVSADAAIQACLVFGPFLLAGLPEVLAHSRRQRLDAEVLRLNDAAT